MPPSSAKDAQGCHFYLAERCHFYPALTPAKGEDKYYVAADNIDMSSVTHNLMPPADPAQSGWPTRRCLQAYSTYD